MTLVPQKLTFWKAFRFALYKTNPERLKPYFEPEKDLPYVEKSPNRPVNHLWVVLAILGQIATSAGYALEAKASDSLEPIMQASNDKTVELPAGTRSFYGLSISPDGEKWLFVESTSENKRAHANVLSYDMAKNKLYRYALPEGYEYYGPTYSPDGKWVAIIRSPENNGSKEDAQKKLFETSLMIMRPDGRDAKIHALDGYAAVNLAFSADSKRIAFTAPASVQLAGNNPIKAVGYSVYEYAIGTKKVEPFAPAVRFALAGPSLQYKDNNTLVLDGYDREINSVYGSSEVYTLRRNMVGKIQPDSFGPYLRSARNLSIDLRGQITFAADHTTYGAGFLSLSKTELKYWRQPFVQTTGVMRVAPTGAYVGFLYETQLDRNRRAYGLLDLKSGNWRGVSIPALESAVAIPIHFNPR